MISVAINVKNGAKYLSRCLNALRNFDDIVILDNYSTDNTLEIASGFVNVRVFQAEFNGMGNSRNLVATYAKYDWLVFVDCDEVMHPKLVASLLKLKLINNTVYQLLRYNFYDNYLVDSSSWGNDWVTRIYNRTQTSYTDSEVHESVITKNLQIKKITTSFIFHFPYDNISGLIDKMQFYSSLYAKQNLGKKKVSLYLIPLRSSLAFIKFYLLKGGFKQGFEGLIISSYNAIGVFAKYTKLYELNHKAIINLVLSSIVSSDQLLSVIEQLNNQLLLPHKVIFVFESSLLNTYTKEQLTSLVNTHLIIPHVIIYLNVEEDPNQTLASYLSSYEAPGYFIQPNELKSLANPKFLKRYKSNLAKAKGDYDVKVYRLID